MTLQCGIVPQIGAFFQVMAAIGGKRMTEQCCRSK
jgi:hypothetical protein